MVSSEGACAAYYSYGRVLESGLQPALEFRFQPALLPEQGSDCNPSLLRGLEPTSYHDGQAAQPEGCTPTEPEG